MAISRPLPRGDVFRILNARSFPRCRVAFHAVRKSAARRTLIFARQCKAGFLRDAISPAALSDDERGNCGDIVAAISHPVRGGDISRIPRRPPARKKRLTSVASPFSILVYACVLHLVRGAAARPYSCVYRERRIVLFLRFLGIVCINSAQIRRALTRAHAQTWIAQSAARS